MRYPCMACCVAMQPSRQFFHLVTVLLRLTQDAFRFLLLGARSSAVLKGENLFLRKQLALFVERKAKPQQASDATRLTLVLLSRLFTWRVALINVKPETFLRWHRKGFQLLWRWKSRPRGRPRLPVNLRKLIVEMTRSNPSWGEERIAAELLLKLGIPSLASDGPTLHAREYRTSGVESHRSVGVPLCGTMPRAFWLATSL